MPAKKSYPLLQQIKDGATQQALKKNWDTTHTQSDEIATLRAQVAALQQQVASLQSAVASLQNANKQALVTAATDA